MNGLPGGAGAGGAPPAPGGGIDRNDPAVKAMNAAMESCFGKSAISGVMGFGMGGLFGVFMASMSYDTPYHTGPGPVGAGGAAVTGPGGKPFSELPLRRQLAVGFKDMGVRSWGMAKNFGMVGAMFSGIECGIEGFRAKNDLANGVAAGCLTGGILARGGGPIAVGGGCAAFAAFSAAIDMYMRSPGDE